MRQACLHRSLTLFRMQGPFPLAGSTVASGGFLRTGATRGTPFHISVPWWTYCVSYRDYWKRVRPFPRLKCSWRPSQLVMLALGISLQGSIPWFVAS